MTKPRFSGMIWIGQLFSNALLVDQVCQHKFSLNSHLLPYLRNHVFYQEEKLRLVMNNSHACFLFIYLQGCTGLIPDSSLLGGGVVASKKLTDVTGAEDQNSYHNAQALHIQNLRSSQTGRTCISIKNLNLHAGKLFVFWVICVSNVFDLVFEMFVLNIFTWRCLQSYTE